MKKIFILLIILSAMLSLTSCGEYDVVYYDRTYPRYSYYYYVPNRYYYYQRPYYHYRYHNYTPQRRQAPIQRRSQPMRRR